MICQDDTCDPFQPRQREPFDYHSPTMADSKKQATLSLDARPQIQISVPDAAVSRSCPNLHLNPTKHQYGDGHCRGGVLKL
jgi:hypothetical protein